MRGSGLQLVISGLRVLGLVFSGVVFRGLGFWVMVGGVGVFEVRGSGFHIRVGG